MLADLKLGFHQCILYRLVFICYHFEGLERRVEHQRAQPEVRHTSDNSDYQDKGQRRRKFGMEVANNCADHFSIFYQAALGPGFAVGERLQVFFHWFLSMVEIFTQKGTYR